ncbi:PcfJ domain-containing protein [Streptomyces avermitilis]
MSKANKEFVEFSAHFPAKFSEAIKDYATNVLLLRSRYMFFKSVMGVQFGYCTHCRKTSRTEGLKHTKAGMTTTCSKCGSICKVRAAGISKKFVYDSGIFVYYEKSRIDPQAIVARTIYAYRDYTKGYEKVETMFSVKAMYVFKPGKSQMFKCSDWHEKYWFETSSVYSILFSYNRESKLAVHYDSIAAAVKGTPFQYSTWEHYTEHSDLVEFFSLYSRYPCVEYLTKFGMKYFVEAKLKGSGTYGAINWNGKTIDKVLRLTKHQIKEIKEMRDASVELHPLTLRLQQITRKDQSNLPLSELQVIAKTYNDNFDNFKKPLKYTTLRKAVRYVEGQSRRRKRKKQINTATYIILGWWKDYLTECEMLNMDLSQEQILFPPDVYAAHQKTMKQVEVRHDELVQLKIDKRVKDLEKYCFTDGKYLIRPAHSADELIQEGKELGHCVGTYVNQYKNGSTNIFVIRMVSQPDKPFFTMEIKNNRITQNYGKGHATPKGDLVEFVAAFTREKLTSSHQVSA